MNHLRDDDIARLDWAWIGAQLDAEGYAILPGLLDGAQTRSIAASIDTASVVLPEPFSAWRNAFYPHLALLSEPEKDFTGGEFVMTEQRPRMQSRPMVLPLHQGDVAIITVAQRPCKGGKAFTA